jgi:hypothetical protein
MYSTYRNEIQKLTGKKMEVEPIITHSNHFSEREALKQMEADLRAKRNGHTHKHITGSFVDDHNSSFHKDIEMLSLIKKDKENRSKKTLDAYPLDYQTYKKNLESKKKNQEDILDSRSLSLRHEDVNLHPTIKRGVNKRNMHLLEHPLPAVEYKNKYYDTSHNLWNKFEYRHPGNFVYFLVIFLA